ncbi:MAG: hypothetical protein LBU66_06040 [Treponema sp.]|jgi:hypothetical protein|nr:hypothetical protein [Treponema sp.]
MPRIVIYAFGRGGGSGGDSRAGHAFVGFRLFEDNDNVFATNNDATYGFYPKDGTGRRMRDDSAQIPYANKALIFDVLDADYRQAKLVLEGWLSAKYFLGTSDCVSFVYEIIEAIRRNKPIKGTTYIPLSAIDEIQRLNPGGGRVATPTSISSM